MAKVQSECDPNNPEEAFVWMFAAGVPDPRGEKFPHQPMIPPQCLPVLSKMIWDMGGRFHPELQTKWVKPRSGVLMNFEAWGTTDVKPEQIQELAEQEPEVAEQIAGIAKRFADAKTPEEVAAIQGDVQAKVFDGLDRIKKLTGGST